MAGFKRGGFRGGGGGAFKKGYAKKRSGSDEEDNTPRPSKKTKGDEDEDANILVPELKTDEEGNEYVALNASGKRRVTISSFKGNTLVSIREYWTNDEGELKPGKKGISMTVDQYNALLAAAPLLESALEKKDEEVIRPNYDADATAPTTTSKEAAVKAEDAEEQKANDDEEEE